MTSPLAYEKVWFEKCKYDEAERQYFEKLAKLLINNGLTCNPLPVLQASDKVTKQPKITQTSPKITQTSPLKEQAPVSPAPVPPSSQPQPLQVKDERRFKPKEAKEKRNKADKKGRDRRIKDETKGSPNTPLKNSLAGEVAKARQHIKNSLECMDGIAALATNVNVELVNRLNNIEKNHVGLTKLVSDLQAVVKQLENRLKVLEVECKKSSPSLPCGAPTPASTPSSTPIKKETAEDDDDGVDLFASDSDEESEAAKKVKEERLAAYHAKKSKKPVLIAKSNIILDVKPWDDETDMKEMEKAVRAVETDGLLWGASKLVPLAYGIHKLQISCVVEDEKVSVDWLQEKLEEIEDYVQSVDIAAFNKV